MENVPDLEPIPNPDNGAMLELAKDNLNQALEILEMLSKRTSFEQVQNHRH
jgi:hypothetical protein